MEKNRAVKRLRADKDPPGFGELPDDSVSPPFLSAVQAQAPLSPPFVVATYLPETAPYGEHRRGGHQA